LKSGIPSEQDYALHHLVKISMERGDKYRFESFPGLAEALIEKVLEVSSLFYKIEWQTSYTEDGSFTSANTIDGLNGTPDILEKISRLAMLPVDDNIQTAEFSDALLQVNEAALTLRNMVMLEENAHYVSELYPLRDFISIALNLPNLDSVVELKHYALDIAEQLTKYISFNEADPLYISLLAQLQSQDRGAILTALRAISRISMNLEENNLLKRVPVAAVQNIIDWTLLHDEDLVHACLDFLYQYTAVVDNVDFLITEISVDPLINQLTRLLMHNVKIVDREVVTGYETKLPAPTEIVSCPQELLTHLLRLDEPERSSQWLRCLFEEDSDEYITQIALWQAYQARFTNAANETGRPLLPAAEFIKNVSTTFADKATAQVQTGATQKFIIKGIRMRSIPVDLKGDEFTKCLWRRDHRTGLPCGEFFMSPEQKYQHILKDHLGATQRPDGQFNNTQGEYTCQWDRCQRFKNAPETSLEKMGTHIKVHLPPPRSSIPKDSPDYFGQPPSKRWKPSYMISPPRKSFTYQYTATDENNQAAGIPLSAVLVLRNLARNISKTETEENAVKEGGVSWVDRLFKPVEPRLFDVMAHNKSLVSHYHRITKVSPNLK
jgi:chromatin structure-remodeling complex subunit RSC9